MKIISAACALAAFWGILPAVAQNPNNPSLEELTKTVTDKSGPSNPPQETAINLRKLVEAESFAPSAELPKKVDSYKKIFSALANQMLSDKPDFDSARTVAILSAFSGFFSKLDAAIEENYKWQPVSANVSPPQGVPMAAAGMDPNQIQDPDLKRQYLTAIEAEQTKNLKNVQQRQLTNARLSMLTSARNILNMAKEKGVTEERAIQAIAPAGTSRQMLTEKIAKSEAKRHSRK